MHWIKHIVNFRIPGTRTLLLLAAVLLSCSVKTFANQGLQDYLERRPDRGRAFKTIEIPIDLEKQNEFQRTVESGSERWRLDAEEVACDYLRARPETHSVSYCWVRKQSKTAAFVTTVVNKTEYRVYLRRLVKPDGIWTPVKLEVEIK
jgi:hypothetical protein